jgi:hypothetical protein
MLLTLLSTPEGDGDLQPPVISTQTGNVSQPTTLFSTLRAGALMTFITI